METNLSHFTDMHVKAQKVRVAAGNRLAHLKKYGRSDDRCEHIYKMAMNMESTLEEYIAEDFKSHPTYPWTSRIKGCGLEAAPKVIGIIEGVTFTNVLFSDLKDAGIVKTMQKLKENWAELEDAYSEMFQRRSSIYAFDTTSKLRRFAGLAPIDGKTEKVSRGQKGLHYSPELRMMLWRLLTSLMRAKGVWYEKYKENDDYYTNRFTRNGFRIIETPPGRYCPTCQEIKEVSKTTRNCPDCGDKLMPKREPPHVVFRGHVVNMAKRRTIRLWLDCLYLVWREALGLPVRGPYIVEYGGHDLIDPWSMVDKPLDNDKLNER